MNRQAKLALLGVIAILFLLVFASIAWLLHRNPKPKWDDPVKAAYLASVIAVKKVIPDKNQPVFSVLGDDLEAKSVRRHDGDYDTAGFVDETNDNGHQVRADWQCVMHPQGGTHWKPVYVHVADITAGTYVPDKGP